MSEVPPCDAASVYHPMPRTLHPRFLSREPPCDLASAYHPMPLTLHPRYTASYDVARNVRQAMLGGRTALQAAEMQDPDAATFLRQLRKVGTLWMLAFPGLVMTAWIFPALWRHRYVTGGLAVLQSSALLGEARHPGTHNLEEYSTSRMGGWCVWRVSSGVYGVYGVKKREKLESASIPGPARGFGVHRAGVRGVPQREHGGAAQRVERGERAGGPGGRRQARRRLRGTPVHRGGRSRRGG